MSKLFLDTNFLLDLFEESRPNMKRPEFSQSR
jgi:predicted nucleic acid-binding protein